MGYNTYDQAKIEKDISDTKKNITNVEHEELRIKMSLVKANDAVTHAKRYFEKAKKDFDDVQKDLIVAENDLREVNTENANIVKEKSALTQRLTLKDAELAKIVEYLRKETDEKTKK